MKRKNWDDLLIIASLIFACLMCLAGQLAILWLAAMAGFWLSLVAVVMIAWPWMVAFTFLAVLFEDLIREWRLFA